MVSPSAGPTYHLLPASRKRACKRHTCFLNILAKRWQTSPLTTLYWWELVSRKGSITLCPERREPEVWWRAGVYCHKEFNLFRGKMKKLFVVLKHVGGSRREQETRGVSMTTSKVLHHSPDSRGHSDLDFKNWGWPYQVFNPILKRKP